MAYAHLNAAGACAALFNNANVTEVQSEIPADMNIPGFNNTDIRGFNEQTCVAAIFLVSIIFGVVVFVVALLFYVIPGALGVCGAQNKSTGLVCAYIVCLVIIILIDIAGIASSFTMHEEFAANGRVSLIISAVGIVLTVVAVVVAGNYRTAVKQDENTVALI